MARTAARANPAMSGVSPATGPVAGGTKVTITGSSFEGASSVHFGSSAATSFTVESPETISAVVPLHLRSATHGREAVGQGRRRRGRDVGGDHGHQSQSDHVGQLRHKRRNRCDRRIGFAPGVGATGFKFASKKASLVERASSARCTAVTPAGAGTVTVIASVGKLKSSSNPPGDTFTYE